MFSRVFLAQTQLEMAEFFPDKAAYMALHFSSSSHGLSNEPKELPINSILLLDDSMPVEGHDPQTVSKQLTELVKKFSPAAILLDFQRPVTEQAESMASHIIHAIPCPVAATENYAMRLNCPVFLSPVPPNRSLETHLKPWLKQGVYLEIATDALRITVTEQGSSATQIPSVPNLPLADRQLHCHYDTEVYDDRVIFTLCRYKEDLLDLVKEAEDLGVLACLGLYAELIYP